MAKSDENELAERRDEIYLFPHIHMSIFHINAFVERSKMSIRARAALFSNSFGESSPYSVFLVRDEYFPIDN